jgi:hypothetical protein
VVNLRKCDCYPVEDWEVEIIAKVWNLDPQKAYRQTVLQRGQMQHWDDDKYYVMLNFLEDKLWWGQLLIRRKDEKTDIPYQDMLAIKNQTCGEHMEAIQLFPSMKRHIDTSNTYHLWVTDKVDVGYNL